MYVFFLLLILELNPQIETTLISSLLKHSIHSNLPVPKNNYNPTNVFRVPQKERLLTWLVKKSCKSNSWKGKRIVSFHFNETRCRQKLPPLLSVFLPPHPRCFSFSVAPSLNGLCLGDLFLWQVSQPST